VRVFAFTARRRAAKYRIVEPREAAIELLQHAEHGPVSILFGREDTGLPNDALDRAHAVVTIPTTDHASINLAQAVLIALYELHLVAGDATRVLPPARKEAPPPTAEELEMFFEDAARALERIQFFKTRYAEHIMRSLRAMVGRADPDARELMLLRAIFIEVVRYIERTQPRT
jgi:TrmH family RNA methyltransferase